MPSRMPSRIPSRMQPRMPPGMKTINNIKNMNGGGYIPKTPKSKTQKVFTPSKFSFLGVGKKTKFQELEEKKGINTGGVEKYIQQQNTKLVSALQQIQNPRGRRKYGGIFGRRITANDVQKRITDKKLSEIEATKKVLVKRMQRQPVDATSNETPKTVDNALVQLRALQKQHLEQQQKVNIVKFTELDTAKTKLQTALVGIQTSRNKYEETVRTLNTLKTQYEEAKARKPSNVAGASQRIEDIINLNKKIQNAKTERTKAETELQTQTKQRAPELKRLFNEVKMKEKEVRKGTLKGLENTIEAKKQGMATTGSKLKTKNIIRAQYKTIKAEITEPTKATIKALGKSKTYSQAVQNAQTRRGNAISILEKNSVANSTARFNQLSEEQTTKLKELKTNKETKLYELGIAILEQKNLIIFLQNKRIKKTDEQINELILEEEQFNKDIQKLNTKNPKTPENNLQRSKLELELQKNRNKKIELDTQLARFKNELENTENYLKNLKNEETELTGSIEKIGTVLGMQSGTTPTTPDTSATVVQSSEQQLRNGITNPSYITAQNNSNYMELGDLK